MLTTAPRGGRKPLFSRVDRAATDGLFRIVALAYVAFSLGDCVTTAYVLAHGGRERNPIASSLYGSYGMGALVAFKAAVVAVILVTLGFLPRRPAVWVATAFCVIAALAVAGNLQAFNHLR